ncbi:embryonic polarity protein dorsal-like isoform X2 [Tribolium madens]|nr:embryonic polarity protein dorsal-like isoform X2 [Tribolium madens]
MRDESINISDVIEVIETDPDFKESTMFNGGGEIPQNIIQQQPQQSRRRAYVKIIEQPASKALRFRYECEGRSAGSIPGASSTPENKTFPSIQVVGYQGRAVVVVSCVTKDEPYRPHPHNLVGREGCKKGVCTMEINSDTMCVTFSNLGIQCVKKKDIESALRLREEIKVDPFMTGFSHRNQPTSIDLNAVRLCFQVFLEGERRGKFTVPLTPVVSEPIYDKKAMSDLMIVKLSHCNSYVDGGRNEIILLCEKVAKEDIQVRFFEEINGKVVWEGFGDFQPSQVHKQTAICFKAPRYHTLDITEPVKVFIQLRRPSDGATSEALPFELLPLDSGRPLYWSLRKNYSKKGNYNLFSTLLASDAKLISKHQPEPEKNVTETKNLDEKEVIETNNNDYSKIEKPKNTEEKSFNELINQVAELDEIYSETQARLLNEALSDVEKPRLEDFPRNESFDDGKTYSSLQLAFKNPIEITENEPEIEIVDPPSPIIDITARNKRESEAEKPPLPPKRTKKIETFIGNSMQSINEIPKAAVSRSHSFNLTRPKSQDITLPAKLPPTPCSTLPNPKKKGLFSKLFGRKSKTPGTSRETSLSPSVRTGLLGQSAGNISTNSATSIRIPLKDSPPSSLNNLNQDNGVQDMDLTLNLDLTEAEHYALYTAMAPHATQSEFDEMSCYYAPVEGGKILTNSEMLARLTSKT